MAFNHNRPTPAQVAAALLFAALAVFIGVVAYRFGQNSAAPVDPTATPTAQPVIAAQPPPVVTNTPTATVTPAPTGTNTPTPTFTPTATPSPTPTPIVVITHIKNLGRLETTEFAMRTVVDLANPPDSLWQKFFGSDKLLLVAEGEVVAGFDLTKVAGEDISVDGTSVEITLPAPEILYSRIDNDRTQVYERKTGLFVTPDKSLESRARQIAEESLTQWATERGIQAKAEAAGRQQIENLLRSLGFTNITIVVKKAKL